MAALFVLGAGACREPLPRPPVTDTARRDAGRDTSRPPTGTGGTGGTSAPDGPEPQPIGTGGNGPPPTDAGDAMPMVDVRPDAVADLPRPDGPAPGNCGLARPDLTMVTGTTSLAVAKDGTIYFSQVMGADGFVGRLRPTGTGMMALSPRLVRIPGGTKLAGMAIDRQRNWLYVVSASGRSIYQVNLNAMTLTATALVIGVPAPSELVLGTDGNMYYSEQSDRRIYRLTPTGLRTQVTLEPLGDATTPITPAGLTFGPLGELYVGSASAGPITRLTLGVDGVERARARFGSYSGVASSLAFDGAGRLYIAALAATGDSQVVRLDATGATSTVVGTGSQLAALAFGVGALDCRDLYVTSKPGAMLRIGVDVPGTQ